MKDMRSILIVEDEIKIAKLLLDYLAKDFANVHMIHDGITAMELLSRNPPDLLILDIMLPGVNGMEICRKIRETSDIPIMFLTAKSEETDKLAGFELEADDYIVKPFSPKEVVARVHALLRRSESKTGDNENVITRSNVTLNTQTRDVTVSGKFLKLTPKEFEILKTLISQPYRVFSRDELLTSAMGHEYEGYDRTIDTHMKNLRKKMTKADPDVNCIESIYGVGYRFNPNQSD